MRKYIIITPAKNEAAFIGQTIDSVINQTLSPIQWIIIDDGSTDKMPQIIEEYAVKYSWISLIKLKTSDEERMGGSKVVNAFNSGFELVKDKNWDFIVKLDGDLILPPNYFEEIANIFKKNPNVGLAGGVILNKYGDKFVQEGKIGYHIRGAFKSYRKECFLSIGGFKPIWNWDGIDEMEAMHKGWETKCVDLKVKHLRPTTAAYNREKHAFKSGYEAYRIRMSLFLLFLRSISMIRNRPYLICSYNFLKGHFKAYLDRPNFLVNKELAKFINNFHYKRILNFFK